VETRAYVGFAIHLLTPGAAAEPEAMEVVRWRTACERIREMLLNLTNNFEPDVRLVDLIVNLRVRVGSGRFFTILKSITSLSRADVTLELLSKIWSQNTRKTNGGSSSANRPRVAHVQPQHRGVARLERSPA
jgi:hypothetical protein